MQHSSLAAHRGQRRAIRRATRRGTRGAPYRATLTLLASLAALAGSGSPAAAEPVTAAAGANQPAWCGDSCELIVTQWNVVAYKTIMAAEGYQNPLTASRSLAMMHLAMHDAVNLILPRYRLFAGAADRADADADAGVAAIAAAHGVLAGLYPTQAALLQAELAGALLDAGTGSRVEAGKKVGARAATAILASRSEDGHAAQESFQEGRRAGEYRFVPGTDFIAMPHWRRVSPFALGAPTQFRVAPPPALTSREYAMAFQEVKSAGAKDGATARTPDQGGYAAFWYEFSDIGWNRVARTVAQKHKQDLWQRARTFALLNVALADAYIAGWDSKIFYNFWRPVTAIRHAERDGNPATVADPGWNPLLPTPPIQDHPSTHSALGAAAAAVLAEGFGRDDLSFTMSSPTASTANPARRFSSFSAAARENADSRVRAGLHFRFSVEQGLKLGAQVAGHATGTLLTPLPRESVAGRQDGEGGSS